MVEQKIIVGKFINNLDSEDLTSEKLQGVVNNVYAKAISSHKKKEKEVEDNTKDLEKETVEFIKSNHDRLKANKEKPDKELNEKKSVRKPRNKINEDAYDDYFGDKGVDYLIGLVKDIAKKGDLRKYNLTQSDFYEVWDGLKELKKNRSFDTIVENVANFIGENSNLLVYSKGNGWHIEVNNMYESKELKEGVKPSELWYNKKEALNNIWGLVCEGDDRLEDIRYIFESGLLKPNEFRYDRFGAKHSLIMGALRNGNYKTAELLKSLGEKILKSEVEEYKDLMARKVYSDETTRDALDEDKTIAKFQDDDQVHEIHDYENGTFANHYDAKTPGHMISYYDSEKEARKQMRRHRPFAKEIKESRKLKEDLTDIKQEWEDFLASGKNNVIEFDDGDYVYFDIDFDRNVIYAGSAANAGILRQYEVYLDPDLNLNENIAELYDEIVWEKEQAEHDSFGKQKIGTLKGGKELFIDTAYGSGYQLCSVDGFGNYNPYSEMGVGNTIKIIDFDTPEDVIEFAKKQYGDRLVLESKKFTKKGKQLKEAKSSKKLIYTIGDRFVAHQLDGVTSPFNREFDAAKKYRDISNDSNFKHGSIGCKGKSYKSGVNQWVKDVEPTEFMVWTKKESPSWKDDVLDVYYKKETINESKKLTEEVHDGDMFEFFGLQFSLTWLDHTGDEPDEFAIVCDSIPNDYDNEPTWIGKTVGKDVTEKEIKKLCWDWIYDQPEETFKDFEVVNELPDGTWFFADEETVNSLKKEFGKNMEWLPHENMWQLYRPKEKMKVDVNELPWDPWEKELDYTERNYGPDESLTFEPGTPLKEAKGKKVYVVIEIPMDSDIPKLIGVYSSKSAAERVADSERRRWCNVIETTLEESLTEDVDYWNGKQPTTQKELEDKIKSLQKNHSFQFNGFEIYNNGDKFEYFHNSMEKKYSRSPKVVAKKVFNFKYREDDESLKESVEPYKVSKVVALYNKGLITAKEAKSQIAKLFDNELLNDPQFNNTKIKDFYTDNYPEDDLGEEIADTVTVPDVVNLLNDGRGDDFYSLIGVSDSLVRERILAFIADACGVKYDVVYKKWLGESLTESKELTERLEPKDLDQIFAVGKEFTLTKPLELEHYIGDDYFDLGPEDYDDEDNLIIRPEKLEEFKNKFIAELKEDEFYDEGVIDNYVVVDKELGDVKLELPAGTKLTVKKNEPNETMFNKNPWFSKVTFTTPNGDFETFYNNPGLLERITKTSK